MSAAARVSMLVEVRAVEQCQAVRVARKMRGRPIENHSDGGTVAAVDTEHEIGGLAEAAGYGVIAERLISPRSIERMLHQRHELDMRVAHALHIGNQLGGEL